MSYIGIDFIVEVNKFGKFCELLKITKFRFRLYYFFVAIIVMLDQAIRCQSPYLWECPLLAAANNKLKR